jgi:hypothetical protein
VTDGSLPGTHEVRAAEVIAALSLATDLGMGFPLEHSLYSAVVAMRLADRLGVDAPTASQAYYGGLLSYIGCTARQKQGAGFGHANVGGYLVPLRGSTRWRPRSVPRTRHR